MFLAQLFEPNIFQLLERKKDFVSDEKQQKMLKMKIKNKSLFRIIPERNIVSDKL